MHNDDDSSCKRAESRSGASQTFPAVLQPSSGVTESPLNNRRDNLSRLLDIGLALYDRLSYFTSTLTPIDAAAHTAIKMARNGASSMEGNKRAADPVGLRQ